MAPSRSFGGKQMRLETIDGVSARSWPQAQHLRDAGFGSDLHGLTLEA